MVVCCAKVWSGPGRTDASQSDVSGQWSGLCLRAWTLTALIFQAPHQDPTCRDDAVKHRIEFSASYCFVVIYSQGKRTS